MANLIFEGAGNYFVTDTEVTVDGDEDIDVTTKDGVIIFGRNTGSKYNISVGNVSNCSVGHNFISGNTQGSHNYNFGVLNGIQGNNAKYHFGNIGSVQNCAIGDGMTMNIGGKRKAGVSVHTGGAGSVEIDDVRYKRVMKDGKRILVPDDEDDNKPKQKEKAKETGVRSYALNFKDVTSVQAKGNCGVQLNVTQVAPLIRLEASGNASIGSSMFIMVNKVRAVSSGNGCIGCTWDTVDFMAQSSGNSTIKDFYAMDEAELTASGNSDIKVSRNKKVRAHERVTGNASLICAIGNGYVLA